MIAVWLINSTNTFFMRTFFLTNRNMLFVFKQNDLDDRELYWVNFAIILGEHSVDISCGL